MFSSFKKIHDESDYCDTSESDIFSVKKTCKTIEDIKEFVVPCSTNPSNNQSTGLTFEVENSESLFTDFSKVQLCLSLQLLEKNSSTPIDPDVKVAPINDLRKFIIFYYNYLSYLLFITNIYLKSNDYLIY